MPASSPHEASRTLGNPDAVLIDVTGSVMTITMNMPEVRNAITPTSKLDSSAASRPRARATYALWY